MYTSNIKYSNTYAAIRTYTVPMPSSRVRAEDRRSELRIIQNRIRRQREMRKNLLIAIMTICLIITCSFTLNAFRSSAKSDPEVSYKYYKSIAVANNDTLWSIAERYMDEDHYGSINDYINEVRYMNSLSDDSIHYGEYLIVPYYDSQFIE